MTPSLHLIDPLSKLDLGRNPSKTISIPRPAGRHMPASELLDHLANGLKQVFFCLDSTNGHWVHLSEGCEQIWGRTREALHADPRAWRSSVIQRDRPAVDLLFTRAERGEPYELEYQVRLPGGVERRIRERGVVVEAGFGATNIVGVAEELTENANAPHQGVLVPESALTNALFSTGRLLPDKNAVRVLIADGRPLIRRGVASTLARNGFQVSAEVDCSDDVLSAWRSERPDVLLLDQDLPSSGAIPLLRELREKDPAARVILLGRTDQESSISVGLRSGARAFLSSNTSESEILQCMRLVHAGQTFVSQSVALLITAHMSCDPLTGRELEILSLIAAGKSNKRIARELAITENTVKSHVHKILGKTETSSRTAAASMALRRGLVSHPS
jgi:DNA-binding NarL/FixJ family response regulator